MTFVSLILLLRNIRTPKRQIIIIAIKIVVCIADGTKPVVKQ